MINTLIKRGAESKFGTFGRWYFPNFVCYTLELPDRDNRRSRSRIPAGDYSMEFVTTGRPFSGRQQAYWINPVDARTGILAHSGTWAGDVEQDLMTHSLGCILVGYSIAWLGGQPGLLRSRPCIWHIMDNVLQGEPAQVRII